MNVNSNSIIENLIDDYYSLFPDMLKISVKVIISDCLSQSHFELRPDMKERLSKLNIENDDNYNGRMVMPNKVGSHINILMNRQKMIEYTEDGTFTWKGTLAHELTHSIDYHQMAIKEKLTSYDPLMETSKYLVFQMWSEYHARKLGYTFLRKQLNLDTDDSTRSERIEHILTTEWPHHMNQHLHDYHNAHDMAKEIYFTMQLLGRLSVWCELFPDIFNETFIRKAFDNNLWMYHIFIFLQKNTMLDEVYPNLDDMRRILKENWGGLY